MNNSRTYYSHQEGVAKYVVQVIRGKRKRKREKKLGFNLRSGRNDYI